MTAAIVTNCGYAHALTLVRTVSFEAVKRVGNALRVSRLGQLQAGAMTTRSSGSASCAIAREKSNHA